MATLATMMEQVKARLGSPRAQRPSNHQILVNLSTQIQRYLNRLNLSERPWAVDEVSLVVVAGVEDYAIPATNFGRAIQVRTVYPANPSHIERDIDFFELGDANFNWPYPKNFGALAFNPDGSPNTAQRMAFFRRAGQNQAYVRVVPIPQQSATYQILYNIGDFASSAALAAIPILPEHHALIEIRTALSVLPMTEWSDNAKENSTMRGEFALALKADEVVLDADFNNYIRSMSAKRRPTYKAVISID